MKRLSERLQRLLRAKLAIRAALEQQGQPVGDTDALESYAERIAAIGCLPMFPAVAYTGESVRRLVQMGEDWYYEWELRSSGTMTTATPLVADFYLVGGGGRGGAGGSYTPEGEGTHSVRGGGGGASTPVAVTGLAWNIFCNVVVGAEQGASSLSYGTSTWTAIAGGNGGTTYTAPTAPRGSTYAGVYYAYGDPNAWVGEAVVTADTSMGADGCSRLSLMQGRMPYSGNGGSYSGIGYGAGGGGASSGAGAYGAQGVVLMRVKMTQSSSVTLAAMLDVNMDSGDLLCLEPANYDGPGYRLDEAGQLVRQAGGDQDA